MFTLFLIFFKTQNLFIYHPQPSSFITHSARLYGQVLSFSLLLRCLGQIYFSIWLIWNCCLIMIMIWAVLFFFFYQQSLSFFYLLFMWLWSGFHFLPIFKHIWCLPCFSHQKSLHFYYSPSTTRITALLPLCHLMLMSSDFNYIACAPLASSILRKDK